MNALIAVLSSSVRDFTHSSFEDALPDGSISAAFTREGLTQVGSTIGFCEYEEGDEEGDGDEDGDFGGKGVGDFSGGGSNGVVGSGVTGVVFGTSSRAMLY